MTDYARWNKFDESEAEQNIEEQLRAQAYEEQLKKAQRTEEKQQKLASKQLKQSSAAIASKAAVDALKAKGGPNRRTTRWLQPAAKPANEAAGDASVSTENSLTILSEGLEWCLQQSEQARTLMKDTEYGEASETLFAVVGRINELRGLMEQLDEPTQQAVVPTLRSLLTQTLDSIATCSSQQRRFAAASDASRDLLLLLQQEFKGVDDIHWWVQRGKALLGMDAPYLASLHLNHAKLVATRQSKHKTQQPVEEREVRFVAGEVTEEVVAHVQHVADGVDSALENFADEMKELSDQQLVDRFVIAALRRNQPVEINSGQPVRPSELLSAVRELYHQGLVILREQFYRTAQCKFLAVLRLLDGVTSKETLLPVEFRHAADRIRACAHVNVATCLLNRNSGFENALDHCEQALRLDEFNIVANVRSAQLYCEMHRFDEALEKLQHAQLLASNERFVRSMDKATREPHATQYPLMGSLTKNSVSGISMPPKSSQQMSQELQSEIDRVKYLKRVHIPSSAQPNHS